jgi:hypothetical protein
MKDTSGTKIWSAYPHLKRNSMEINVISKAIERRLS